MWVTAPNLSMFRLLVKFFNLFFVATAFHVCFMHLIDTIALIVSNDVLIVTMTSETVNIVGKTGVFYTYCK